MKKGINLAIVGATGAVGQTMLEVLEERKFPVKQLFLLASARSTGNCLSFKRKEYTVQDLANFDFKQADIALFSAGSKVSAQYAPLAAQAGCVVIDNTSYFRQEKDIPLVIPEVNIQAIHQFKNRYIIANPNCSTIQMLVALKPLYDAVGISRINVATYQSVSGSEQSAISELANQTRELLNGRSPEANVYPHPIAFNLLPHIDQFEKNGYTREEMKMIWETRKILADDNIQVNPTAVRVPVFYGHSEAIHLETKQFISAKDAKALLKTAPGVKVWDDTKQCRYPTPQLATGKDAVYVGRIRQDLSHPLGLNLWVVADNIRKGAALNAIQLAEYLLRESLLTIDGES